MILNEGDTNISYVSCYPYIKDDLHDFIDEISIQDVRNGDKLNTIPSQTITNIQKNVIKKDVLGACNKIKEISDPLFLDVYSKIEYCADKLMTNHENYLRNDKIEKECRDMLDQIASYISFLQNKSNNSVLMKSLQILTFNIEMIRWHDYKLNPVVQLHNPLKPNEYIEIEQFYSSKYPKSRFIQNSC